MRLLLIPKQLAISRFCVIARNFIPIVVRYMRYQVSANSAIASTSTKSRNADISIPRRVMLPFIIEGIWT